MQAASGTAVQLSFFEHTMTLSPAWSPDGERIAFVGDQNGVRRVWTMSANGGNAEPLENTNASGADGRVVCWPSSDIVYEQPVTSTSIPASLSAAPR
jgi:Tol biopolymer transport system component